MQLPSLKPGDAARHCAAALLAALAGGSASAAPPDTADALYAQAVAIDYGSHSPPDAARAFALYLQAAAAGSALAQLNAAVMLDSGRGTPHDAARAATYYALAASQGVARAAYDLGQLYADGEGVPANPSLARAWLRLAATEGIAAASSRLRTMPASHVSGEPTAPRPVMPSAGAVIARPAPLQLVWTVAAQPAVSQFYVQVAHLQGTAPQDVFTAQSELSAIQAKIAPQPGRYAWRVFTVCQPLGRYVSSPWVTFSIS